MTGRNARQIAVVGGGPAGLMAAERLALAGHRVCVIERMPSVARKFLMAGRGGLNLTHSEPLEHFLTRYGTADEQLIAAIKVFQPGDAIDWAEGLGQATMVGTSGRVFPKAMKASPLLRAWLRRLDQLGVAVRTRTAWTGFGDGCALCQRDEPTGATRVEAFDAVVLAAGGASWPRLGSDGQWVPWLADAGISTTPFAPANAGVRIAWSEHLRARFQGRPLKRIGCTVGEQHFRGEAVVTAAGLEGGVIYAAGEALRQTIVASGVAELSIDLRPDLAVETIAERLGTASAKQSLGNRLRKSAGLDAAAIALFHEAHGRGDGPPRETRELAHAIKSVPLQVTGFTGLERAISSAGGVPFAALDERFMLTARPGFFVAGEMLDWTAPTGGYLLQACLATGVAAANGATAWLLQRDR